MIKKRRVQHLGHAFSVLPHICGLFAIVSTASSALVVKIGAIGISVQRSSKLGRRFGHKSAESLAASLWLHNLPNQLQLSAADNFLARWSALFVDAVSLTSVCRLLILGPHNTFPRTLPGIDGVSSVLVPCVISAWFGVASSLAVQRARVSWSPVPCWPYVVHSLLLA